MIREVVLRDFPNWDSEKQLSEYQAYKAMGDYSPFNEADYQLMEMVMNNPNAEIAVECEDGVCSIISTEEKLDEAALGKVDLEKLDNQEKRNKLIHLLDIIFDDDGSILPDTEKLKAPMLVSSLKTLITSLKKSGKTKMDVFFSKNEASGKYKDFHNSMFSLLGATKIDKVKFSKNNQIGKLLSREADEAGILTLDAAMNIPFIKLIIYIGATDAKGLTSSKAMEFVFDDEKINLINQNKALKEKIKIHTAKIAKVIKQLIEGVDSTTAEKLETLENTRMNKDDKELEKLKIIGVEEDDKTTPGKKIATEIENTHHTSKRKVILEKIGYSGEDLDELLNKINSSKELSKIDESLDKSTAIKVINERWSELKAISPNLAETLYNKRFSGEGKGERLIEFLVPTMSVNGGAESYDLKGPIDSFEVKAYQFDGDFVKPIKLGVEGKATQSDLFNEIQVVIARLQDIFMNERHYDVLKSMINGAEKDDILKDLVARISEKLSSKVDGTKYTFKEALSAGEFPAKSITSINEMLTDLNKLFNLIKDNEFFYMKVIGKKHEIYKINNTEKKSDEVLFHAVETEITLEQEKEVISSILDILDNQKIVNGVDTLFTNVLNELEKKINADFKEHPMILLYDTGSNDSEGKSSGVSNFQSIANGLYDDFKVQAITRGNAAIVPTEHFYGKYNK